MFHSSNVDSGYSVDNIPPQCPGNLLGQVMADGSVALRWAGGTDPDVAGYRVYRGTSPDFLPLPENRIAAPSDTGLVVPNGSAFVYKVTAVDTHENEGPSATWILATPVGIDRPTLAFALQGAAPNPSRDGSLVIRFSLPGVVPRASPRPMWRGVRSRPDGSPGPGCTPSSWRPRGDSRPGSTWCGSPGAIGPCAPRRWS